MKLLVLGATGPTGKQLVKQALEQDDIVTAFVRNPSKLTQTHQNLKIVKGNIFSVESLCEHLTGQDAVVSCLGFPRSPSPVTGYTDNAKCLVEAMQKCNVSRFVTITAWWTDQNSVEGNAGFLVRKLVLPYIRPVLDSMKIMEDFLQSAEAIEINYTVVRPPGLGNGSKTDKRITAVDGAQFLSQYSSIRISRADVARFMLSCLKSSSWDRKMVAIAYE